MLWFSRQHARKIQNQTSPRPRRPRAPRPWTPSPSITANAVLAFLAALQVSCIVCYFLCLASRIVRTTACSPASTTARDPPHRLRTPSPSSSPPSLLPSSLLRFRCLLLKVHHTRHSRHAPCSRPALPLAHAHPHPALANHSSLVLLPRPAVACHDPHTPAYVLCSHECPMPRYALLPCAPLATIHQASKTWLLHNITESPLALLVAPLPFFAPQKHNTYWTGAHKTRL